MLSPFETGPFSHRNPFPQREVSIQAHHGNVAFSVEGATASGNYIDGPAYVVVPNGTAMMAEPTPHQSSDAYGLTNGVMINPQVGGALAFDAYGGGALTAPASFPAEVTAGDVIVKAISLPENLKVNPRHGVCSEYGACFIVPEAPAPNSFSPAAIGWQDRGIPQGYSVDLDALLAGLPSHDDSGFSAPLPSFAGVIQNIGKYAPLLGMTNGVSPTGGYQAYSPYLYGKTVPTGAANYGRDIGSMQADAALALISPRFTTEQKRQILIALIQVGINIYDPWSNGTPYGANGGHLQYTFLPAVIALNATGRAGLVDSLFGKIPSNELHQPFKVTAERLASMVPHDLSDGPHTWRRRELRAVEGLDVTIQEHSTDPYWLSAEGLRLTRESDGASALITSPRIGDTGNDYQLAIDAQPTPPFAVSDIVYFDTPYPINEGDFNWRLTSASDLRDFSPSATAAYRNLQSWSGGLLALCAMGFYNASFEDAVEYSKLANQSDTPSAENDFPMTHGTGDNLTWRTEYWETYAGAVLPTPAS